MLVPRVTATVVHHGIVMLVPRVVATVMQHGIIMLVPRVTATVVHHVLLFCFHFRFDEQLDVIFSHETPVWDTENKYKPENIEVGTFYIKHIKESHSAQRCSP